MKTIPSYVKIHGRNVFVNPSARGYVVVGESSVDLTDEQKKQAEKIYDTVGFEDGNEKWNEFMYLAFEQAVKIERKRLGHKP